MMQLEWYQWAIAAVVAIIGSARVTRLITHDSFPPIAWLRARYEDHVSEDWGELVHCPWCMGPWVTLLCLGWFLWGLFWLPAFCAWILFWVWMSMSYLVSQYVHFDEGRE